MSGNAQQRRVQRRKILRANAATTHAKHEAYLTGPVVIKAIAAVAGQPARPPRIDIVAYNGGELLVDGFDLPVVIDLSRAQIPPTLPLNVDHQQDIGSLLGQGVTTLTASSLSISGTITADNPKAREVVRLATDPVNPFPWQASIKAIIFAHRRIAPGQRVQINGREFIGPIIEATESQLTHCAVLGEGADQTSTVRIAAKAAQILKGSGIMSFEDWVKSLGLDPATLNPALQTVLQADYAEQNPTAQAAAAPVPAAPAAPAVPAVAAASSATTGPAVLLAASRKAEADEVRRVGEIRAKARDYPLIAAKAIEEGWNIDKVELEVLKAHRPTGPSHQAVNEPAVPLVLEAALAMSRRIPGHEKQYPDQVLQAAHSQFRRGIGLQQVLLIAAAANGYHCGPGTRITMGNISAVLEDAFPDRSRRRTLEAAASGASIAGILSNIANKELLAGYQEEDQTWREVAAVKSVSDFKTVTSYRMLDDMAYEALAPDGKIAHGKLNQMSYTRQAATYAKMFALTRTDIINDDLGALDDLKSRVGRGGAIKLNRVFWTKFLSLIGSLFTSGNGNYISGATTNLVNTDGTPNYAAVQLALNAFDAMRTPATDGSKVPGGKVGGAPAIMLTPGGGIANAAEVIYKHSNLNTGAVSSDLNNYAGKYRPVKSVFLDDSTISGYTADGWALLRDPKMLAAIVVSFLDGVETPTVEQADADFDQLGIQFRGYHDFGVDAAEPLAGVWVAGE